MIILLFFGGWGSLSDSHEIVWSKGWHTTVDSTSSSICRQSASASLQWTTSGSCISRAILICLMNTSFCWAAYWPWLHTQQSYWPWLQTHNRGVDHSYKHPQQSYWPRLQTHTTELLTKATNNTTELLTKATNNTTEEFHQERAIPNSQFQAAAASQNHYQNMDDHQKKACFCVAVSVYSVRVCQCILTEVCTKQQISSEHLKPAFLLFVNHTTVKQSA